MPPCMKPLAIRLTVPVHRASPEGARRYAMCSGGGLAAAATGGVRSNGDSIRRTGHGPQLKQWHRSVKIGCIVEPGRVNYKCMSAGSLARDP
eukprot:scaffold46394_cov69-Phaeocystis_antarctica.AAC.1